MTQTVSEALDAFLARYQLKRELYQAPSFQVTLGPIKLTFPNPQKLPLHDLHHVALEAPPAFWGEVEVSAFELRGGTPSWLIWFLCVGSLGLGLLLGPRRTIAALRRYRGCQNLYQRPESYQELLSSGLGELRCWMRLPEAPTR